jgi:glycosyltransferase involved in cell wall biosynthesis
MTDARPLVSVVVIFLDEETFIEDAIQSVLDQTYTAWEMLLVDDGSTDRSAEIARGYADRLPDRVRYLRHPHGQNLGMSASRNLGIRHSQGEYVAFLDADDAWLPGKLQAQVALLDSQPEAAMVYGPAQWWYSWSGQPPGDGRDFIHELGVPGDSLISPPTLLGAFLVDEGISPCTCSILVRRGVLDRVGGFEDEFRGLYEDQVLCAKICLEFPVFASSACFYRYRQHGRSALATAERAGTRGQARGMFLEWLAGYLEAREITNPEVWNPLQRERGRQRLPLLRTAIDRGLAGIVRLRRAIDGQRGGSLR